MTVVRLQTVTKDFRLQISVYKTKDMEDFEGLEHMRLKIVGLNDEIVEQVNAFSFLDCTISLSGDQTDRKAGREI